ncbi:non-ribosomal peptide synthetase [Chitinophaga solisilvae]|uniref:non-ribosomal peptide synthetase n=1 Tax=Chitinophaga solisilvae TaxID=1233460 RepID=UPI0013679E5A|nr:amino acid adenylation domain-containing protein [Chitinophaga solisilvae]
MSDKLKSLTTPQKNIWYECLKYDHNFYEYTYVFEILGNLDVSRLDNAILTVIRNHDIFRTTIIEQEWEPYLKTDNIRKNQALKVIDFNKEDLDEILITGRHDLLKVSYSDPCKFVLVPFSAGKYYFFFSYHHIMLDGNSLKIIFSEISAVYNRIIDNLSFIAPLKETSLLAEWESTQSADAIKASQEYWEGYIGSSLFHIELPHVKYPQPPVNTGNAITTSLSPLLSQQIRELARSNGTTVFKVLFSAFSILLYRVTGLNDFITGYYADLRPPVLKQVTGYFVGLEPYRHQIKDSDSFISLMMKMEQVMSQHKNAAVLPYSLYGNTRKPVPRSNVTFAKTVSGRHFLQLQGTSINSSSHRGTSREFDFFLSYDEGDQEIQLYAEHSISRQHEVVAAFFSQYITLLSSIVENPHETIGLLPMLSKSERNQILTSWAAAETVNNYEESTISRFEKQAQDHPDHIAVVFSDTVLTYSELDKKANQAAHYLQQQGITAGAHVAFYFGQSADRIITMLGIWKLGAIYVALDPIYPAFRSLFILEDAAVNYLITQVHLSNIFSDFKGMIICIDQEHTAKNISAQPTSPPWRSPENNVAAYINYTSGSTGLPKGIIISHRGLSNMTGAYTADDMLAYTTSSRVLQFASICFDASVFEIWGALSKGAHLFLYPDNRVTGIELHNYIIKYGITNLMLTPTVLATLPAPAETETSLKTVVLIGEAFPQKLMLNWYRHVRLFNGYGPTETTICVNKYIITGNHPSSTLGRPISNVFLYVLDDFMQPVPPLVNGELYIGGIQLGLAYLNRPDLTSKSFLPDPFAVTKDEQPEKPRMYKSGDLVRYLPDGNIEYMGRKDRQVKIRGFRIELKEIEYTATLFDDIFQAVANIRTVDNEKSIVLYLVHKDKRPLGILSNATINRLREFLKTRLPMYMIPKEFIWIDFIPLTPNGKTDWQSLPVPSTIFIPATSPFNETLNEYEITITDIWKKVLNKEDIGLKDSFFDIGGHSLLLTEVYKKLPDSFRNRLRLPDLFRYHTVDLLAKHLQGS